MKRVLIVVSIVFLLFPLLAFGATLVTNGGFEGAYHEQAGIRGRAPAGWTVVNLEGNPEHNSTAATSGFWVEKIEGEDSHRILAEDFGSVGQPFNTVLYQAIDGVTPNTPYSAAGWFLSLWGGSAKDENDSGVIVKRIGIDSTGSTNPEAASVVWSEWDGDDKDWKNLSIAAVPAGSQATVFLQVWHKWAKDHTDVILDAVEFREAPRATPLPAQTSLEEVHFQWEGHLPDHLKELGPYALYYEVEQRNDSGEWEMLADEYTDDSYTLPTEERNTVVLRLTPKSFQPRDVEPNWPPWTFYGQPVVMTATVDAQSPAVSVQTPMTATGPFTVAWQGQDDVSGVAGYDVQWRTHPGEWQPWFTDTTALSATFGLSDTVTGTLMNRSYEVRVRARDTFDNVSDWHESRWIDVAQAWLRGSVLDVDGDGVAGTTAMTITPHPFAVQPAPDVHGRFLSAVVTDPLTITLQGPDGTTLPPTYLTITGTRDYEWRLPPATNAITNGNFEATGGWTQLITNTQQRHSGHASAVLSATNSSMSQEVSITAGSGLGFVWRAASATDTAQLQVSAGNDSFDIAVTNGDWTYEYLPLADSGTLTLTFTLADTASGALYLDEVSIGEPRPVPEYVHLPIISR